MMGSAKCVALEDTRGEVIDISMMVLYTTVKLLLPSGWKREATQYRRKQVGLPHGEVLVKGREGKFCSFT